MKIEIRRTRIGKEVMDGKLYVEGAYLCDTAECVEGAIEEGIYVVSRRKCKAYGRGMLLVDDEGKCGKCAYRGPVYGKLPCRCPMITWGNGAYRCDDGGIRIGEYVTHGCLLRTKEIFDGLYERVRKCMERGGKVVVEVKGG